jgi:glycosyltransferase involved in cell wall biosynthesis
MKARILIFATEDWFVRSHFTSLVRRGVAEGYEVLVAARLSGAHDALQAAGARIIPFPSARSAQSPSSLAHDMMRLTHILNRERPDLVHAIALRPIALAAIARERAPRAARVFALTGFGHLSASPGWSNRLIQGILTGVIGGQVRRGLARLLVENADDRLLVERTAGRLPDRNVTVLPGAGVDADFFVAEPTPPEPPVRVGLVARLVHSKGVDIAVEAVRRARAEGPGIELLIAGAPDKDNPRAYDPSELGHWARTPGVRMLGRVEDIREVWRQAHVACLPSRGGEGLPRSLIEAAACARPLIVTDVPGCRDFVTAAMGLVVPPEDPEALAAAMIRLAQDPERRMAMGEAARARVLQDYTIQHVADLVAQVWADALA